MGFLDNSGDIILDAVLTDAGRERLARGDGSFNITKFALGDDEINYAIYNKNHASGSAYYDLEILQTPVLEAFTNNTSMMKSKLITISRTNILYLPVILRNSGVGVQKNTLNNIITILVDKTSLDDDNLATNNFIDGYIMSKNATNPIILDQGIQSNEIGNGDDVALDADLIETQFIIEVDNRLGKIWDPKGAAQATPSFIDDDNIASYYFTVSTNPTFVGSYDSEEVVAGPRGNRLSFLVGPTLDLQGSTYLFTQLGTTSTLGGVDIYQIDTNIRISGATSGYRIDVPVRFVKKK